MLGRLSRIADEPVAAGERLMSSAHVEWPQIMFGG